MEKITFHEFMYLFINFLSVIRQVIVKQDNFLNLVSILYNYAHQSETFVILNL